MHNNAVSWRCGERPRDAHGQRRIGFQRRMPYGIGTEVKVPKESAEGRRMSRHNLITELSLRLTGFVRPGAAVKPRVALLADRSAATAAEYALLAGGIALAIIATVNLLGLEVLSMYEAIRDAVSDAFS